MEDLPWTGERLVTYVENYTMVEHLHRYSMLINLVKDKIVLDIASGEGYGSHLLSNTASFVYGVDIDNESVKHANAKYAKKNLTYRQGSASQIPIENFTIDVVVSFETLEHHDQHEEMLTEIKRILKPGGLLIMSTPEKVIPENNPFHVKELTNAEFQDLIARHFKNVSLYFQRIVMGSLIVPQKEESSCFSYYKGNYKEVSGNYTMEGAIYNICVASDVSSPSLGITYFEGERILVDNMLKPYLNSRLYRLSSWIKKKLIR
ncbi:class I SAM-dependent methyltransferase [Pedobacter borealis]|uniref:class I SAM-dependent methyltransferase n=1 Tax=Pedobacter borealis TaxID=475254 RepID=UPI00068B3191|nr:class I SAM-dependent methyltransferase [Pedobacter borealis]